MDIRGKTAIVTGGGSGLGEATARMLAKLGANVGVMDLNADAAARVADDIGGVALPCDVTDEDGVNAALDQMSDIRILVNCAGIAHAARIVGPDGPMPLRDFERTIHVNLVGTFNMMRLAAERMSKSDPYEENARGTIINTASFAATDGQIGQAAYAASKGGIVSLALPAAREFARFGIRVNTIAPGIFRTPLMDELPPEAQDSLVKTILSPSRLGEPAEFAQTVRFCIENEYLNAEVIRLDAGTRLPPK